MNRTDLGPLRVRGLRVCLFFAAVAASMTLAFTASASATSFAVLLTSSQAGAASDATMTYNPTGYTGSLRSLSIDMPSGWLFNAGKVKGRCFGAGQPAQQSCSADSRFAGARMTGVVLGVLPVTYTGYLAMESVPPGEVSGANANLVLSNPAFAKEVKPVFHTTTPGHKYIDTILRMSIPNLPTTVSTAFGTQAPFRLTSLQFTGNDLTSGRKRVLRNSTSCGTSGWGASGVASNGAVVAATRVVRTTSCPYDARPIQAYFNPKEITVDKPIPWRTGMSVPDPPTVTTRPSDPRSFEARVPQATIEPGALAGRPVCTTLELERDACAPAARIGRMCMLSGTARIEVCGEMWNGGPAGGGRLAIPMSLRHGQLQRVIWIGTAFVASDPDNGDVVFNVDGLPQLDPRNVDFDVDAPLLRPRATCATQTVKVTVRGWDTTTKRPITGFALKGCKPTITSGPEDGGFTNDSTPTFRFEGTEPASTTYSCNFDNSEWNACTSPVEPGTPLTDGQHTFAVRDSLCTEDSCAARRTFTVDTAPPVVQILSPKGGEWVGCLNDPGSQDADVPIAFRVTPGTIVPGETITLELEFGVDRVVLPYDPTSDVQHAELSVDCREMTTGLDVEYRVAAIDRAGNKDEQPATFRFDKDPPTIVLPNYLDQDDDGDGFANQRYRRVGYEINVDDSDVGSGIAVGGLTATCTYEDNRSEDLTVRDLDSDGRPDVVVLDCSSEGNVEVSISVHDGGGHVTVLKRRWTIDNTVPTLTLIDPPDVDADGDGELDKKWLPANFEFKLAASDAGGVDEDSVTCKAKPKAGTTTVNGTKGINSPNLLCRFSDVPEGDIDVEISVADRAGNVATLTRTATVDATPPVLTYEDPRDEACDSTDGAPSATCYRPPSFGITFVVDESGSVVDPGASTCQAIVSGRPPRGGSLTMNSQTSSTRVTCSFSDLPDGDYEIETAVADSVGHVTVLKSQYTVDSTAPEVVVDSAMRFVSGSVEIPFTVFDDTADPASVIVEYSVDGGPRQSCCSVTDPASPSERHLVLIGHDYDEGPHVLTLYAIDRAGNQDESPAEIPFTVDSVSPRIDDFQPRTASFGDELEMLFFDLDEANPGVSRCELYGDSDPTRNLVEDDCDDFALPDGTACDPADPATGAGCRRAIVPKHVFDTLDKRATLQISHTDLAGNSATVSTTLPIDRDPPVLTFTDPRDRDDDGDGFANQPHRFLDFELIFDTYDEVGIDASSVTCRGLPRKGGVVTGSIIVMQANRFSCTFTGLPEDDIDVEISAADYRGHVTVLKSAYTVDTTAPAISFSQLKIYDNRPYASFSFSIEEANRGSTTCMLAPATDQNAGIWTDSFCDESSLWTGDTCECVAQVDVPVPDGDYVLRVTHRDLAGHETTESVDVTIDRTPPSIDIMAPAEGATVECPQDPADPDNCRVPVRYLLDDASGELSAARARATLGGALPGAWYEVSKNIREIAIDELNIDAREMTTGLDVEYRLQAVDSAGNESELVRHFRVTRPAPPRVTILAPRHDAPIVSATNPAFVELEFSVEGASGVINHSCTIDGIVVADPCTSGQSVVVSPGSHVLEVFGVDEFGNSGSDSEPFFVALEGEPALEIEGLANGTVLGKPKHSVVKMPGRPIYGNRVLSSTGLCVLDQAAPVICDDDYELDGLTSGPHTFSLTVTDQNGAELSTSVDFIVDLTPPTVQIHSPANGSLTSDRTPQIVFTVNDDHPASTTCTIDNGPPIDPCVSGFSAPPLPDGVHVLSVIHRDLAARVVSRESVFFVDSSGSTFPPEPCPPGYICLPTDPNDPQ